MFVQSRRVAALALAACAASACTVKEEQPSSSASGTPATATPAPTAANVVTIDATDFAFAAPDTVPAGLTTIRLVTSPGREMHHATLVKLTGGKTFADFAAAMKAGTHPMWALPVGGPNPPAPGGVAEVVQSLEPGDYAIVCYVPSADGVPHFAKGMIRALTVVDNGAAAGNGSVAAAELPAADIIMTLSDYAFETDVPLTAGKHVIRVETKAAQPHEVVLAELAPGKTVQDLVAWMEKQEGPPPGKPIGGVAGLMPGTAAVFPVDLAPGEYAMICFIPDAKDGKPHFVHGMMKQVKVS
ncbi:MAG TPA: hypothetical protein VHQ45_16435 [Gemmatimonadaceae bacterium]|nr:hypothetical protein [Gemmatimonadaceae bacterium]